MDADRGVLVGATSAGPSGGEVLSALAVAVERVVDDVLVPLAAPSSARRAEPARV